MIMIKELSDYYQKNGFDKLYVNTNKEPRRVATLRTKDGVMTSMSYAKYIYTSYWECDIPIGEQIDHINGDKMDDRIENLQKISQKYNNLKDKIRGNMEEYKCPVCGALFLLPSRCAPFRTNPCCSRKCGGIKSHWIK